MPKDKIVEIEVSDVVEDDLDKEKWLKNFDEWMANLDPNTPYLTDEQISRESIYEEQINKDNCEIFSRHKHSPAVSSNAKPTSY